MEDIIEPLTALKLRPKKLARLSGAARRRADLEARRADRAKVRRRDFIRRITTLRFRWIRVGAAGRF